MLLTLTSKFLQQIARFQLSHGVTDTKSRIAGLKVSSTSLKVCGQVEHGILALFGPSDPLLGSHIASICDALDIPHLESRNDIEDAGFNEFSLNLHPSQDLMNQAYRVRS